MTNMRCAKPEDTSNYLLFFSGHKRDIYGNLLDMESTSLYDFLDEIPDGNESDINDATDDEILEDPDINNSSQSRNNDVFDIESMPIIFDDGALLSPYIEDNIENQSDDWSSEDEYPLSVIKDKELAKQTIWTKSSVHCIKTLKEFSEISGPNVTENIETPTDIFLTIFPDRLFEQIAFQTNLYALQKAGGNPNGFVPTNAKEIKSFIAINLIMGIKKLPSYCDYWSSRAELRDSCISSIMSRNRFAWMLSNIHINDNSVQPDRDAPNYDKLYKVRPLLDILSETYKNALKPSKNQAIDESMIKFKGRSLLKQYMPNKPVKRGYKVWIRAEESGYVCQFQIYVGKVGNITERNLGGRVVHDLTRDLVACGYHIYFDNFFNSVALQKSLREEMIYACGTVRKGRKDLPKDLVDDKCLKRGDSDWRVSLDGLTFLKWMDNRPVYFLSNYLNPSNTESVQRKKKDGSSEEVSCPELVKRYNDHMGYVDKMDMLKACYEVDRKSKKWWHRIFFYFVDVSLVNAFILYTKRTDSPAKLSLKLFRLSVALGLVGAEPNSCKRGRPSSVSTSSNHFKRTVPYEIRYDS